LLPIERPLGAGKIPGYVLLRELGRGGMGVVYLARHEQTGAEAVIKLMLGSHEDPVANLRFRQEAQALAAVSHRNVVDVKAFGELDGRLWFAMSYVRGRDLESLLREELAAGRRPSAEWIADRLAEVAGALRACHHARLLHRDVKPANILIAEEDGRAVLVDFGLAKRVSETEESQADLTRTGTAIGTPSYMPPEQLERKGEFGDVGPASDVWGLGATLFWCFAGRAPVEGGNSFQIAAKVLTGRMARLAELAPEAPGWACALSDACLRLHSAERIDMGELERALTARLQPGPSPAKSPWAQRIAAGALLCVILLGGAALGLWKKRERQRERARIGLKRFDRSLTALRKKGRWLAAWSALDQARRIAPGLSADTDPRSAALCQALASGEALRRLREAAHWAAERELGAGQPQRAAALLAKLKSKLPGPDRKSALLGARIATGEQDMAALEPALQAALEGDSPPPLGEEDRAQALFLRARFRLAKSQTMEALADLIGAQRLHSTPAVEQELIALLIRMGRIKSAEKRLLALGKKPEDDPRILLWRARQLGEERFPEAIALLRRGCQKNPQNEALRGALLDQLARQHLWSEFAQAATLASEAIPLPSQLRFRLRACDALLRSGNVSGLRALLVATRRLANRRPKILAELDRLDILRLWVSARFRQAQAKILELSARFPQSIPLLLTVARMHNGTVNGDQALRRLKRLQPAQPEAAILRAHRIADQRRVSAANAALASLRSLTSSDALHARGRLIALRKSARATIPELVRHASRRWKDVRSERSLCGRADRLRHHWNKSKSHSYLRGILRFAWFQHPYDPEIVTRLVLYGAQAGVGRPGLSVARPKQNLVRALSLNPHIATAALALVPGEPVNSAEQLRATLRWTPVSAMALRRALGVALRHETGTWRRARLLRLALAADCRTKRLGPASKALAELQKLTGRKELAAQVLVAEAAGESPESVQALRDLDRKDQGEFSALAKKCEDIRKRRSRDQGLPAPVDAELHRLIHRGLQIEPGSRRLFALESWRQGLALRRLERTIFALRSAVCEMPPETKSKRLWRDRSERHLARFASFLGNFNGLGAFATQASAQARLRTGMKDKPLYKWERVALRGFVLFPWAIAARTTAERRSLALQILQSMNEALGLLPAYRWRLALLHSLRAFALDLLGLGVEAEAIRNRLDLDQLGEAATISRIVALIALDQPGRAIAYGRARRLPSRSVYGLLLQRLKGQPGYDKLMRGER